MLDNNKGRDSHTDEGVFKRRNVLKYAGVSAATGLAGCSGITGGGDDTLKIGFISSLSGPYSSPSESQEQGAEIAVDEINEEGGVLGNDVELLVRDDELSPDVAARRGRDLVESEEVDVLSGAVAGNTMPVYNDLADSNDLIYLAGASSMRNFKSGNYTPNTWTSYMSTDQYVKGGLEFLQNELDVGSIFGIYSDYAWGQECWLTIGTPYAEELGLEVTGEVTAQLGQTDFSSQIRDAMDSGADAVVLVAFGADKANAVAQMKEFGLDEEMEILTWANETGLAQLGGQEIWEDVYGDFQWHPTVDNPLSNELTEKYQERYDYPGTGFGQAIRRGIHEWKRAAENAGSTEAEAVIEARNESPEFESAKGDARWRSCDSHTIQSVFIGRGKPIEEQENEWDIFEVVQTIDASEDHLPNCDYIQ